MSDEVAPPKAPAPPPGGAVVKRETNGMVFPCLFGMKPARPRRCDLDPDDDEDLLPVASLGGQAAPVPLAEAVPHGAAPERRMLRDHTLNRPVMFITRKLT